jgi:hypothetical protein
MSLRRILGNARVQNFARRSQTFVGFVAAKQSLAVKCGTASVLANGDKIIPMSPSCSFVKLST